jgi:hypothetical protein
MNEETGSFSVEGCPPAKSRLPREQKFFAPLFFNKAAACLLP